MNTFKQYLNEALSGKKAPKKLLKTLNDFRKGFTFVDSRESQKYEPEFFGLTMVYHSSPNDGVLVTLNSDFDFDIVDIRSGVVVLDERRRSKDRGVSDVVKYIKTEWKATVNNAIIKLMKAEQMEASGGDGGDGPFDPY